MQVKKRKSGENLHKRCHSFMNNDKELIGTLKKPTPTSEQLSMKKKISALVLSFFLKSLFSKTLFEIKITNAVTTYKISKIKISTD